MKGARILFFDPDPRSVRAAERALLSTGSDVEAIADEAACRASMDAGAHDLLMVNFDPPMRDDPRWSELLDRVAGRPHRPHIVLNVTSRTEDYLPLLARRSYVRNLIARNDDPLDGEELIITAEKLLRRDLFGLDKYLMWGVQPFHVEIRDSGLKHEYIGEVARYAARLGANDRTVELIETIADELVTNAIYNAPRDDQGRPKYAALPRRERVVLAEHEVASLAFACDGNYIAIAQTDRFGALTQDTVIDCLNRCLAKGPAQISEGPGGAGLGLFRVFDSLSKLIFNLESGHRTEVICLVDLRLSMKRFRQLPKSFHIFRSEPAPAPVPAR